jgi:DNA-binding winged helix-turn-helix (wHTH) protein/tetratricopeptide (TPR) repeat protein
MNRGDASFSPKRSSTVSSGATFRFEECEVDPASYRVLVRGEPVALEPRVFELLVYLIEHRERVVAKEELFDRLWAGKYVTESTLTRAVYEVRRALGDDSKEQRIIKTLHGRGYQFVAALRDDAPSDRVGGEPDSDSSRAESAHEAPAQAPAVAQSVRSRSRWILPAMLSVLVVVVAIFAATWYRSAEHEERRERIAIMPFTVDANAPDLEWAELGLSSLLAETLSERSNVTVLSANRVRQALLQRNVALDAPQHEQLQVLRDVFGVDHVLFAHVSRDRTQLSIGYDLVRADGRRVAGSSRGQGAGSVTADLASALADAMDVAYKAGVPIRKIGPDEFVNEAFARGLQAQLGGQLEDSVRYFEVCLSNDPANGWAGYELGNTLRLLSRWPEAARAYDAARLQGIQDGDTNLEASAEVGLGLLAWRQGRLADAEKYFEAARERYESIERRANLAAAYGNLGILAENRRDLAKAREYYERALALYLAEGERAGESAVYTNLAVIERKLGNMDAAATLQQRAADLQRRTGLHQLLVFSLAHLGEIERERGNWPSARAAIDESLQFALLMRDRLGEADALAARGALELDFERFDEASADLRAAYAIYEELGNPAGLVRAALQLIEVTKVAAPDEAHALAETALSHARQLEDEALALEIELIRAELQNADLAALLPRLQVLGDHRLLALSWAVRARRNPTAESVRAALAHAERSGAKRLQAVLAVELARLMLAQGAPPSEIESVLSRARAWQAEFPPKLVTRACHLAQIQRTDEAHQALARATSLLARQPDMSWCPGWQFQRL